MFYCENLPLISKKKVFEYLASPIMVSHWYGPGYEDSTSTLNLEVEFLAVIVDPIGNMSFESLFDYKFNDFVKTQSSSC